MDSHSASPAAKARSPNEKNVRFGTLQIRHFPIIPGDNPAVTVGCPVTIDWQHDGEVTLPIDEYEEARSSSPRSMIELRRPAKLRDDMLRGLGFSRGEIQRSTKLATIARNRRKRTEETMQLAPLQELLERAKRGALNVTVRRVSKQREKDILNQFVDQQGMKRDSELRMSTKTSNTLDASIFSLHTSPGTSGVGV